MRVKRYVVDSMPDAMQKIRADLGKDAVILNTKQIKFGGFLGLFGKKKIEVIAAQDAAQSPKAVPPVFEERTEVKEPLVFRPKPQQNNEELLSELRQMKAMMAQISAQNHHNDQLPLCLKGLEQRLLEQEVHPELAVEIIKEALASAPPLDQLTDDQALELVKSRLLNRFTDHSASLISPDTNVVHFVGPTGVGKTTTIAKMAAEQVLKHHRKVGFITSDTYRIAAVEQLRTYANILNVPLEVVFSPQELTKAFHNLQEMDLIFMDTAGRNFRNEMYVSELNSLLASSQKSETYLVLSLTTKYKDMKVITENFSKFKLDKVLFTKMDETDTYGSILNLIHDFPLKLSYITTGQNVPDDISKLNEVRLVDLILEEKADG